MSADKRKRWPDRPRIRTVEGTREETPTTCSFVFRVSESFQADPGQFLMVWLPGEGEIPLSISNLDEDRLEITVKGVGPLTKRMNEFDPGEKLGLRGPYGQGFSPPRGRGETVLVGGGCGIPPLRFYYLRHREKQKFHTFSGAESHDEILFEKEFENDSLTLATDDGSAGYEGFITDPLKEFLEENPERVERVLTAGPEMMMKKVFRICEDLNVELEASLERYMKCGIGICGSCLIDGFRVCEDGPVADSNQLRGLAEFGRWKRGPSGSRERV